MLRACVWRSFPGDPVAETRVFNNVLNINILRADGVNSGRRGLGISRDTFRDRGWIRASVIIYAN